MGIRKNRIGAATQRPQADPQETARNRTGAAAPRPRAPKAINNTPSAEQTIQFKLKRVSKDSNDAALTEKDAIQRQARFRTGRSNGVYFFLS